jgi:hypothetical protein
MNEWLTWPEIVERYPDQFVLVEFTELDEDLNYERGKVIATASSKDEIYRKLLKADVKCFAIEYTGEPPEDEAYLL